MFHDTIKVLLVNLGLDKYYRIIKQKGLSNYSYCIQGAQLTTTKSGAILFLALLLCIPPETSR